MAQGISFWTRCFFSTQFYSRCFSTRNFCLLGQGSGSVAQLHSGTGDNMNDREAAVGQRKVSENRLSMFPGRCGRVKEQRHTSEGQTVQDTKECGQERASELISVTIPEASGRSHRGSQKHRGEAVLSAAFTRRSDSCAGPETASEIQRGCEREPGTHSQRWTK